MAFSIYISATSPELDEVRAVLLQQINEKGMTAVWLTDEERHRADMLDIVRRKITSADAFISLVTYLHGWTPPNMGTKSLAEIECDLALEAVKPTAILLPEINSEIEYEILGVTRGSNNFCTAERAMKKHQTPKVEAAEVAAQQTIPDGSD